jgi:hypothetical protein
VYPPFVPANAAVPEFTARSVTIGILMVILFSVAATYSGLPRYSKPPSPSASWPWGSRGSSSVATPSWKT